MRNSLLILGIFLVACAAEKPKPVAEIPTKPAPNVAFLEFSYQRGRNSYKFHAEKKETISASTYVDQNMVQKANLSEEEFHHFAQLAQEIFADEAKSAEPAVQISHCRTPFELEMELGDGLKKMQSCRSATIGVAFNELLHEAELLMMQKSQ